jgi:NAD(P)H-hydrate repair Nnr-like enzyme with NAD(P)H-hydrate dehydratase domain
MPPLDAAILAVHLHGWAGEIAGRKFGHRSAIAREVIDCIAPAIAQQ